MITMSDTTDLQSPYLPPDENEMSRRYLRMLEKWIPVGVEYFSEWPERPDCGHFFGGVNAYGIESFVPAEAFAFASLSPDYDEKATGVSRDSLQQMAIQDVRYLCFTHDTGPEECVRPSVGMGRDRFLGTKWGERGEGFFRESQCGPTAAGMARICLMLRNQVDEETWMMVARVHEDYAERFGDMPPRSGVYYDTQMEENGWTSSGLSSCYLFLSRHEQAADWEAMTRKWMFSTCAAPQDARDSGVVGDGVARNLAFKTYTALPDYWAENHGMVHPNYTASGVRSLMTVGTQLRLWGRELPPELFWGRRRVYENLKAVTDGAGYDQAVQGMDWHYLPATGSDVPHAIAAVMSNDPDAAALQHLALEISERRQDGNDGRLYDRDFALKAHDQQDPMIIRELLIRNVAHLYLFHRLFGSGTKPAPRGDLEKRLTGVRMYPHAGFVHHRHSRGQTSLSWRNSIMALPLTREGILTISPCSDSWLGRPVVANRPDSHRLKAVNVAETDDGFAAALVVDRCQESIRQQVLFASLPDGRVLSFERLVATEALHLESLDQGFLCITNEHFPLLAPNCRGMRTLYRPDGSTDYRGWHGEAESDDVIDTLDEPDWLNVDDRLGLRFVGTGDTVYHNRHYYRPYRAIADDLTLSRQQGGTRVEKGETAGQLAALVVPEQTHEETQSSNLDVLSDDTHGVCLVSDGYAAVANFGAGERVCSFSRPRPEAIPVCRASRTEVRGNRMELTVTVQRESATLLRVERTLYSDGDTRVDVMPDGEVYVTNVGSSNTQVSCSGRTTDLGKGDTRPL